ncbi:MAG: hypothetical protein DRG50_07875 [Deltaproteobacteria bacterium]|nr:MAG: hypothetical protein DRG50_07875 [Deltaproteobacteria bacterium]
MGIFITDCEGPISKNDNAMELSAYFIPHGERFFSLLSKYDDYLAYVEKRPGYEAGDTLRLILPFIKAFGATDKKIEEYSRGHILLMPGASETLQFISRMMPAFIISTSYEPYIRALCEVIDFPLQQAYCTKLELDCYSLPPEEEIYLRKVSVEIAQMPPMEWGEGAKGLDDLPAQSRDTVQRLNQIFWEEIAGMKIGRILEEVDPLGGQGKVAALRDILRRRGSRISDVMYVGDSITDLQVLELVKKGEGLAVSFNGNSYAIQGAQVACLGRDTRGISILAQLFASGGKERVIALLSRWEEEALRRAGVEERFLVHLAEVEAGEITPQNRSLWTQKSQRLRRQVRGVKIGALG